MKLQKFFTTGISGDCLALLAGALLTFAFAPFNLFPLAILAPALLLSCWLYVSRARAFVRGWLFGLGLFGTGISWVYISIYHFGNAPLWLAVFITLALVNILALFPACTGYLLNWFFPKNNYNKILLAFPAYWVLLDWARSILLTGFPWLFLGYSQINTFLRGYASIFSVYGVTLVVAVCAGLLVHMVLNRRQQNATKIFTRDILIFVVLWFVGGCLTLLTPTKPQGAPVQVSLVQGNIPQLLKWSPDAVIPTMNSYAAFTRNHWDSKIIVWPEGAIPVPLQNASHFIDKMDAEARSHGDAIILGIPIKIPTTLNFYNAVISIGNGNGYYLKRRLVPFGEYTPFGWLSKKIMSRLDIPMSDFIPATTPALPLVADHIQIATFICYEIAYPELVNNRFSNVGMLLTVSDDAWFGHSLAQAQHLQIAQMRSLELGRPTLFVSNNGLTAVIAADGSIQDIAPPFVPYVLTAKVQPRTGLTLWQSNGTDPLFLIIAVMIVFAIQRQKRKK